MGKFTTSDRINLARLIVNIFSLLVAIIVGFQLYPDLKKILQISNVPFSSILLFILNIGLFIFTIYASGYLTVTLIKLTIVDISIERRNTINNHLHSIPNIFIFGLFY